MIRSCTLVLVFCSIAYSQVSSDEAYRRLRERQTTTQPAQPDEKEKLLDRIRDLTAENTALKAEVEKWKKQAIAANDALSTSNRAKAKEKASEEPETKELLGKSLAEVEQIVGSKPELQSTDGKTETYEATWVSPQHADASYSTKTFTLTVVGGKVKEINGSRAGTLSGPTVDIRRH